MPGSTRSSRQNLAQPQVPIVEDSSPTAHVPGDYRIDEQIGLYIRRAHQRASAIFSAHFNASGLSPLQFTTLVKVRDEGRVSQNKLGRLVHADPATIMGVVNRLADRNLLRRLPDPNDRRRTLLAITSDGLRLTEELEAMGHAVTRETLAPLEPEEQAELYRLLEKIV
ncbi:MarR family transcriptional regulator [Sphingobium sp. Sx8-8]|uniref:MarR family winged helix-turn-helix transcriptional regulator n=1 Tax=Sphingobium sp. Sx8-8 TaxID=2933617 RepID=UPI001F5647E2|nr:MarR family transcriptional regulator [Sphingobium sp. Sx8-8]